jgi:hypothetical protein
LPKLRIKPLCTLPPPSNSRAQTDVRECHGFETFQGHGHRVPTNWHTGNVEDATVVADGGEGGARFVSFGDDIGTWKNRAGCVGDSSRKRGRHLPVGHGRRRDRRKTHEWRDHTHQPVFHLMLLERDNLQTITNARTEV